MPVTQVAISEPPASMASTSPYWIMRMAMPMACVEVVHAVAIARFGPVMLKAIDRWPLTRLMMLAGMKNGDTFFGECVSRYLS